MVRIYAGCGGCCGADRQFQCGGRGTARVPSAISYSVRQLEEWLAVPLFERRHRDVELTPARALFVKEARDVIKK